jgi:response regulator RpfG family c-di-GMP phosphodiesterase
METKKRTLVVDDSPENRAVVERFVKHLGYGADLCDNGLDALDRILESPGGYEMIFTDVNMPQMTGVELLQSIRQNGIRTPVVMITGFPTITLAVDCIKQGATDFLTKPFTLSHFEHVISRIEKERSLQEDNRNLTEALREKQGIEDLNAQLEKKIEELSVMYSISEMARYTNDMEEIFDRMVEMASIITRSDQVSIFLLDRETNHLVPKRFLNVSGHSDPIALGMGIIGKAVLEQRSIIITPDNRGNFAIPHVGKGPFLSLPMMIKDEVFGVLNISKPSKNQQFTEKELHLLQNMIAKSSLTLENHALYEGLYDNLMDTLRSLIGAVEAKDVYTRDHSKRVMDLSILTAREMALPQADIETLRFAGFIHDIGKIGIQDTVLLKPGRLNDEEIAIIRTHPVIGENIVKPLKFLKMEQLIVRHHHERYDGMGYPDGLAGEKIPILARILAVADTYDAITSTRPYRTAKGHLFAVEEIQRCRKTQFDPDAADAFLSCLESYGRAGTDPGVHWERVHLELQEAL